MLEFESGTHTPTVTNTDSSETISDIVMRYMRIHNNVEFSLKFKVANTSQWTTTAPVFTIPTSGDIEDIIGTAIAYGGQEDKFPKSFLGSFSLVGNSRNQDFFVNDTTYRGLGSVDNKMYVLGTDNDALYEVDPETAIPAYVSEVTTFNASITDPRALAYHDSQAYMVSNTDLYTLDVNTGIATSQVGPDSNNYFGPNETSPTGIAISGTTGYMVGQSNDCLYSLDFATGTAARIGDVELFGVNESVVEDIEFHNGILYMIGGTNDCLYTVDTTTGIATRIGDVTSFGDGEGQPKGLASNGTTLYMVGSTRNALYTLDTSTGEATRLVGLSRGSESVRHPEGIAFHNSDLYLVSSSDEMQEDLELNDEGLFRVNIANGVCSRIGGRWSSEPHGRSLASDGTTLYMAGDSGNSLYSLNTTTGAREQVGRAISFGLNETNPTGLTSHNNTLYLIGQTQDVLATLDPITGIATSVGTVTRFGINEQSCTGLASHDGNLYMLGRSTHALYTLNTTTGEATQVGDATNFGANITTSQGLVSHDNKLYMSDDSENLYILNTTTGQASIVGNFNSSRISPAQGLTDLNNELYMVGREVIGGRYSGASYGHLAKLDQKTGIAARVNWPLRNFAARELDPTGMQELNGVLYMVGNTNDCLYTVDTTTGIATRRGPTGFGVNEDMPASLAVLNNTLYMIGNRYKKLYTLDENTGIATEVADLVQSISTSGTYSINYGLAALNDQLYLIASTTSGRRIFGTLNETNGVITQIGTTSYSSAIQDLTAFNNQLYLLYSTQLHTISTAGVVSQVGSGTTLSSTSCIGGLGNTLYMGRSSTLSGLTTLDTTTGEETTVGSAPNFGYEENGPEAVATLNDELYVVGSQRKALLKVDKDTATASQIGDIQYFGIGEQSPIGLAALNDKLYMVGLTKKRLSEVNPSTGEATLIGSAVNFGVGESAPAGLTTFNNKLYMIGQTTDKLYELDISTGIGTEVADVDTFGVGETTPNAIAALGDSLYMIGEAKRQLFKSDLSVVDTNFEGESATTGIGDCIIEDNDKIKVRFEKMQRTTQDVIVQVKGSYVISNTDSDPHEITVYDGDSISVIYRRAASKPSRPSGGSWDRSTFTVPSQWSSTIPSGSDRLYISFVTLHGDQDLVEYSDSFAAEAPQMQLQYSADNTTWSNTLSETHEYIRFSTDEGVTWTTGAKFIGPEVQIQYSETGSSDWDDSFTSGTDKYIRFSTDGGDTWTDGYKFVGDTISIQYSSDNTNWHSVLATNDEYIRFRIGSGSWTAGTRFAATQTGTFVVINS